MENEDSTGKEDDLFVNRINDIVVVLVPKAASMYNPDVQEALSGKLGQKLADPSVRVMILDLREIEVCGTHFMTLLVRLHIRARKNGKALCLCELNSFVRTSLGLAGLETYFEICGYRDEAISKHAHFK